MRNFLGKVTQLAVGPSLGEQPVRGMHHTMIDRLPLCKQNTRTCEADEARQDAVKVGRGAPKGS